MQAEAVNFKVQVLAAILTQQHQMMEQRQRFYQEQVRRMEINRLHQQVLQQRAQERYLQEEAKRIQERAQAENKRLQDELEHLQINDSNDDKCIIL